ncbi:hypothetical protein GCM10027180_28990 [Microbulbifer echini]
MAEKAEVADPSAKAKAIADRIDFEENEITRNLLVLKAILRALVLKALPKVNVSEIKRQEYLGLKMIVEGLAERCSQGGFR